MRIGFNNPKESVPLYFRNEDVTVCFQKHMEHSVTVETQCELQAVKCLGNAAQQEVVVD